VKDDDPVEDFVNACEHVNPEFHQYWINRLEDPDIASEITLHKIIEAFRTFGRRMSKRELNKDISFASFQGKGQDQRNTNKQPKDKDKKKKTEKTCPCGQKHFFKDCPYVNHSIRPKNWKPDHEVEETFKRACENPRFNTAYTEACKKFALKADNDEKTEREDPNFVDFSGATKLIDSSNGPFLSEETFGGNQRPVHQARGIGSTMPGLTNPCLCNNGLQSTRSFHGRVGG